MANHERAWQIWVLIGYGQSQANSSEVNKKQQNQQGREERYRTKKRVNTKFCRINLLLVCSSSKMLEIFMVLLTRPLSSCPHGGVLDLLLLGREADCEDTQIDALPASW